MKWHHHTDGRRAFVVDEHGHAVCEIKCTGDPSPVAARIVREHNALAQMQDEALQERLRHEAADEPRYQSWEDRAADDAAVPRFGPI